MREELAELMHEMWAGWMDHVFLQCTQERIEGKGSEIVIPEHCVKRWSRQLDTSYDELSEGEKDSDRRIADRVLALIEKCVWEHSPGSLVDLPLFQSYHEKQEPQAAVKGSPVPADILLCQSCGKPSSSLSSWTIKDDEGKKVVWLCESCQGTRILTEEYREDADREDNDAMAQSLVASDHPGCIVP